MYRIHLLGSYLCLILAGQVKYVPPFAACTCATTPFEFLRQEANKLSQLFAFSESGQLTRRDLVRKAR